MEKEREREREVRNRPNHLQIFPPNNHSECWSQWRNIRLRWLFFFLRPTPFSGNCTVIKLLIVYELRKVVAAVKKYDVLFRQSFWWRLRRDKSMKLKLMINWTSLATIRYDFKIILYSLFSNFRFINNHSLFWRVNITHKI